MTPICERIFQIWQPGMELWDKIFSCEVNIGMLVLKTIVLKKNPICEGIFQIWQLGMELWDKMFNFEDDIGCLYSK